MLSPHPTSCDPPYPPPCADVCLSPPWLDTPCFRRSVERIEKGVFLHKGVYFCQLSSKFSKICLKMHFFKEKLYFFGKKQHFLSKKQLKNLRAAAHSPSPLLFLFPIFGDRPRPIYLPMYGLENILPFRHLFSSSTP